MPSARAVDVAPSAGAVAGVELHPGGRMSWAKTSPKVVVGDLAHETGGPAQGGHPGHGVGGRAAGGLGGRPHAA